MYTSDKLMKVSKSRGHHYFQGMDMDSYLAAVEAETGGVLKSLSMFTRRVLGFTVGQRGVVANGKVSHFSEYFYYISNISFALNSDTVPFDNGK